MEYFNAFWVGGIICALVQILLDRTKLMPGRIMVLLVCSGAVLGFFIFIRPLWNLPGRGLPFHCSVLEILCGAECKSN